MLTKTRARRRAQDFSSSRCRPSRGDRPAAVTSQLAHDTSMTMSASLFAPTLLVLGIGSSTAFQTGGIMLRAATRPAPAMMRLPDRDPEVEAATGGGWKRLLPARRNLVIVTGIAALSYFGDGTPIGDVLNSPLFREEENTDRQLDAAGTPYSDDDTKRVPTAGLFLLAGYQVVNRVIRPRLAAAAREKEAAEGDAEEE